MKMNVQCPICGADNTRHNGTCHQCLDCDCRWDNGYDEDEEENEDD